MIFKNSGKFQKEVEDQEYCANCGYRDGQHSGSECPTKEVIEERRKHGHHEYWLTHVSEEYPRKPTVIIKL